MGTRRWRRASPAVAQARSGDEGAARRRWTAAGGGERRWPCAVREEAGLGVESKEDDERKLPMRGIEATLTGVGDSRRRRSSGVTWQWGIWARVRGEKGKVRPWCRHGRIRVSGGCAWHGSRGWPARGDAAGRRRRAMRARGARSKTEEERERLTGGPGGEFFFLFFSLGCDRSHGAICSTPRPRAQRTA